MNLASTYMYVELGPTLANSMVGILSAIVDNIPVMVAMLQMNPAMDISRRLLVTLTAGVGGSMLSIGSAAGVALMDQARGQFTTSKVDAGHRDRIRREHLDSPRRQQQVRRHHVVIMDIH